MSKEVQLSDLINNSVKSSEVIKPTNSIASTKEIGIDAIAKTLPGREEEKITNPEIIDDAFSSMHNILEEKKKFIEEEVMPVVAQNAADMAIENELNGEAKEEDTKEESIELEDIDYEDTEESVMAPVTTLEIPEPAEKKKNSKKKVEAVVEPEDTAPIDDLISDIDDLIGNEDDSEEIVEEEETVEETRERIKESLTKIKVHDDLDLTKFTIAQKPLSSSVILSNIGSKKVSKQIDWALYSTGIPVTMSEGSGPELEALAKTMRNSNALNSAVSALRLLYNHIIDENKPSFEAWTKLVKSEDLESLYYAFYKACYCDANLIGVTCDGADKHGCDKTSVVDIDIETMVKFDSDEVKKKFYDILNHDTTTSNTKVKSTLTPISDSIAISYSEPTLYSTIIQFSTLKPEIIEKHNDLLNTMAYINGFYMIDKENQRIVPFAMRTYPNNLNKTILSKLKLYSDILKTLTPDEYDFAMGKLSTIDQESKVQYIIPEVECPECGHKIAESYAGNMLDMVFNRRQLAQIRSL